MRPIDADDLKEVWLRYCIKHMQNKKRKILKDHTEEMYRDGCFAIDSRPTISPQPHWIPCSERLQENEPNYVEYEVTIERGDGTRYVTTSFWIESCGAWEWNDYGVIAWRELSEPYGGDEK